MYLSDGVKCPPRMYVHIIIHMYKKLSVKLSLLHPLRNMFCTDQVYPIWVSKSAWGDNCNDSEWQIKTILLWVKIYVYYMANLMNDTQHDI